jgi:hypothetical protein
MEKLDEILQIIDDVNNLNGWKLKLNKKAMWVSSDWKSNFLIYRYLFP